MTVGSADRAIGNMTVRIRDCRLVGARILTTELDDWRHRARAHRRDALVCAGDLSGVSLEGRCG